ncbi:MAG: AAA family ATPase [Candidatus Syntropharchaeia archaeon]
MRLKKLKLENYGIFHNKEILIPDSNLVLLYGPNEAGKTTLLHAIRESFFGFKLNRNPYDFGGGKMASEVNLLMNDGKEIYYRRTKARKSPIKGEIILPNGSLIELDEDKLFAMFGNINNDVYWNLFGFSSAELAQGEESIKNKEITEVLYGSGMGGVTNIEDIRLMIVSEEEGLFKSTGRLPTLNKLIKQISEMEKEMRREIILPSNYDRRTRELKKIEKKKDELKQKLEEARRNMDHIENLREAREPFLNIKNDREKLSKIFIPQNLPQDMKNKYEMANKELIRLDKELARLRNELQDLERKRDKISFSRELIDEKMVIETLFSEVKRIEACHKDIPKIGTQSKIIQQEIADALKNINSKWDMDFLKSFNVDITVRKKFDNHIKEYRELTKKIEKVDDRIKQLQAEIADKENSLTEEGEEKDTTVLEELLEDAREYTSNKKEYVRLLKEKTKLDKNVKNIWKELAPLVKEGDNIDHPVPLDKTITNYEKDLEKMNTVLAKQKQELESQERTLIGDQEDLDAMVETKVPVDREDLLRNRNHRDKGWELIKKKYIEDGKKVSSEELQKWMGKKHTELSDAYEETVKETDKISDQLYTNSEMVTKKEDLEKRIHKQKIIISDTKKRISQIEKDIAETTSRWNDEWRDWGFTPRSPSEMKEWVSNLKSLLSLLDDKSQIEDQMTELKKKQDEFLKNAKAHYGKLTEKNVTAIMKKVDQEIKEARDSNTRIKQLQKDIVKLKKEQNRKNTEQKHLKKKEEEWKKEWFALLKKMDFNTEWDTETADTVLKELLVLKQKLREDHENHVRLKDMTDTVAEYLQKVEDLTTRLKWKRMDKNNPEKTVKELYSMVSEEQKKAQERKELDSKIEDKKVDIGRTEREHQTYEKIINDLFALVGVKDEGEFIALASRVEQADELRAKIEKNEESLNRLRIKEDRTLEDLKKELEETDFTTLEMEKDQLNTQIEEMDKEWESVFREYITLDQELKKLDGSGRAAEIANEVEFLRSEFENHMDRYISLVIARRLLEKALRRFEKDHQPELLAIINGIFLKITDGRYTQIKASLDKDTPFRVVDSGGNEKTPDQLSTGTREQLYLAIRLGYLEHYGKKAESMPIIMDDVLVNFDDIRAKNTAQALLDIARNKQIIMMTCHDNTVKTFQSINEDIPLMEL